MWCPGPELNRYGAFAPRDFKSRASASFATRAFIDNKLTITALATTCFWDASLAHNIVALEYASGEFFLRNPLRIAIIHNSYGDLTQSQRIEQEGDNEN